MTRRIEVRPPLIPTQQPTSDPLMKHFDGAL